MRKIISLALVLMLVVAMAVPAMAGKYKSIIATDMSGATVSSNVKTVGSDANYYELNSTYEVQSGDMDIKVTLDRAMLEADAGVTATGAVTAKDIKDSKIVIVPNYHKGKDLIKSIKFNKDGVLVIELVNELFSVDEKDFDLTIYFKFDGKYNKDLFMNFTGTIANQEMDIDDDDQSVSLEGSIVGVGNGFNKGVEIYVGLGVTIKTRTFDGKKYLAKVSRDADETDLRMMEKYADVDNVVSLQTKGYVNSDMKILLDNDNPDYYVYDKDMNYLGRGNEELKFSSKYYLANAKLDVVADEDNTTEPAEEDETPPSTGNVEGGGDEAPANINDNPGTGR